MIQMLRNLQLADPRFHGPGQIEILLSAGPTLAAQWIRQIKTNRLNDTDLRLQTLDSIRLGRRREPSRSIDIARISRNYNGFTSGSRPLLENWRETAHHAHFGSWTTMWGALPIPYPTQQRRPIHRRPTIQRETFFTWDVKVRCNEQARLPSSPIPTRQTIWNTVIQEYLDLGHITKITTDHPSWRDQGIEQRYQTSGCIRRIGIQHHRNFSQRYSSYRTEVTRGPVRHSMEIPLTLICPNGRYWEDVLANPSTSKRPEITTNSMA